MGLTKKKDKLDAKGLAILLRNVTIPEVRIPSPSITSVMVDISLCIVGSSQACFSSICASKPFAPRKPRHERELEILIGDG
jgi:hypothetical protein